MAPPPPRSSHTRSEADAGVRNTGSNVSETGVAVDSSSGANEASHDTWAVCDGTYATGRSDVAVAEPHEFSSVMQESETVRSSAAPGQRLRSGRIDTGGSESESNRVAGAGDAERDAGT